MAGDWIKLEKCSPNKPEVMRLARMWGVPQDQAFGALMRFWIWIDDACVDGRVDGVASHEVDDMMHFPGFAAGLKAVGWLHVDEAKPSLSIPNFGKHNEETSKKRALRNARQARWRSNSVDVRVDGHVDATPSTKASTREEKRREEIDNSLRSLSKRATLNAPSEEHEAIANERGLSCQTEFAKYRDWQASTGKRHKDETAGFRNWLRNAKVAGRDEVRDELAARKLQAARNMDILTGKVRNDGRERDISGIAERVDRAPVFALPGDLREPGGDDVEGSGPARSAIGVG